MVIVAEKIINVDELAHEIEREVGFDTRSEVLGHMQRGGSPTGPIVQTIFVFLFNCSIITHLMLIFWPLLINQ